VTDLILNALLIPVYKADGAAIGTLVAEAVVLLVQVWALRKDVVIFFSGIQYFRIVIPTVVSAAVTYFLVGPMDLSEPVRLCFSGLLFFTLYIILLILTGERLTGELLKDMIRFCHKGKKQ
jgi:peptidoglycan biosynthesis protein MviN/MurJ (putative lipid II flippase)